MTQSTAPGIRAMTGVQNQIQFTGSHNGTISHAAISQNLGFFRDTGTAWDQISSVGGGATIYSGDGTLSGNRTISSGSFNLTFAPQTTFLSSLIPSTSGSSYSVLGSNTLTYAAGFSSSNIGNVYSANGAINAQIFSGNATFAQANLASAMVNVNKIDFGSGGHTITMTQSTAPGIRAMTGVQNQIQFTGSHNGTISHAAISQNLGFFRDTGSTRTLTITNAYSLLLNPLDDYGAGFTFTNRWGIYQAGASDPNFFAGITTIANNAVIEKNQNAGTTLQIKNTTAGTNSGVYFQLFSDFAQPFQFLRYSSTSTTFSWVLPNDSLIYQNEQNIIISCDSSSKVIKFGSTKLGAAPMTLTASGRLLLGTTTEISSATMVVTSSTQGFLPPRMTSAQKNSIASPIAGLIVYDSTLNKLCVYTTAWETITSI
jgi:hypothetical protein